MRNGGRRGMGGGGDKILKEIYFDPSRLKVNLSTETVPFISLYRLNIFA